MMKRSLLVFSGILFAGLVLSLSPVLAADAPAPDAFQQAFTNMEKVDPPQPFPDNGFPGLDGREHRLSEFKGKIVLVNFWATWCPPCVNELPLLKAMRDKLAGKDFAVVFISMDFPDTADELKDAMAKHKVDLPDTLYAHDMKIWDVAGSKGLPETFILNRDGAIIYRLVNDAKWDSPEILQALAGLIGSK
jgi:thiol-disulfide isomerase/thioredoxin